MIEVFTVVVSTVFYSAGSRVPTQVQPKQLGLVPGYPIVRTLLRRKHTLEVVRKEVGPAVQQEIKVGRLYSGSEGGVSVYISAVQSPASSPET